MIINVYNFISIFRLEVSSIFIAAILSFSGYSINDTVVIFDRKRFVTKKYKGNLKTEEDVADVVNTSLRYTFNRSIITTMTTLLAVISLIIFGSHEIFNFNIAMLFGLIAGAYSSIAIAAQLWLDITKRNLGKKIKKKWYEEDDDVEELKIKGINS
jgi:SecD/SecF fusion protein